MAALKKSSVCDNERTFPARRKTSFHYFLALATILICGTCPCFSQQHQLWPFPQNMTSSLNFLHFIPDRFTFRVTGQSCDILDAALARWWYRNFPNKNKRNCCNWHSLNSSPQPTLNSLKVNVMTPCVGIYPTLESDESYVLNISSVSSTLIANCVWGALHGLETFSQLVYKTHNKMYVVNETSIVDFPRFKHRGLLLDTSRHFLSKKIILDNLDVMAQNKFNVFHWHIVDDSSFPYQSSTFPELSEKGAYHPITHVYTQADIKEIIETARLLGIRVIPEFDSPGHTKSWGAAFRYLLTICYEPMGYFPTGQHGPINPMTESTYQFMQAFFKEISQVFPDMYIHVGGDEVDFDCWKSNSNIINFMNKMRFNSDFTKLEEYYIKSYVGANRLMPDGNVLSTYDAKRHNSGKGIINIVKHFGKTNIIWQEIIDNNAKVAKDTIIQVWKGGYQTELAKVTSLGYKTLLSSCWYLNYISYGTDWKKYYLCDPQDFPGSDEQKELVIGGEACMWGEYVDDTNLMPRLWPRASVVAERLWSAKELKDYNAAKQRLINHRCRMVRRGIPAQPISGPGFCSMEESNGKISSGNLLRIEKKIIFIYIFPLIMHI